MPGGKIIVGERSALLRLLAMPRHPFVGLALAAALGVGWADRFPSYATGTLVVLFLAVALAVVRARSWLTYCAVAFSFFVLHSLHTQNTPGLRLAERLGPRSRSVSVTGLVVTEPKVSSSAFSTFELQLESITLAGEELPCAAKLLVRWKNAPAYADRIALSGTAEPIPPPRNPGEYDLQSHLAREDVRTQLFCRYAEGGTILESRPGNRLLRAAAATRAWMRSALGRGLEDSSDAEGLIDGMVLGIRHDTPEDIEEPFQQTGTLHLFAVAGLHVGIVAQLLWILATAARLSRRWATALIIPTLFFYVAITGFHTSSVRAAVMSSVLLAGFFADRKILTLNSLAAAAFIVLCCDTNELFSAGFQLSFAVVGTIILISGPIFRWLVPFGNADPFLPPTLIGKRRLFRQGCWNFIARGLSVSIAAWVGSLPLIIWYFNLVTPVAVLANMAVVPIAFFVLATGLLSLLAAPASAALGVIFNNANWALARLILGTVHGLAQLPGGHFYVQRPHWPTHEEAQIMVLDEGVGAATHLRAAGSDWLFDAGPANDYRRLLQPYLHSRGINRLSGLALSHGDAQHIGGAEAVIADFAPRQIVDCPVRDRSEVHRALIAALDDQNLARRLVSAGETLGLAQNVSARVLFPPAGFSAKAADDQALVVQLWVGTYRVLLMSDSGLATEQALLQSGVDLRSDVLVKGQHRSGLSGSPSFLEAVRPELIVATSRDFPASERISEAWAADVAARGIRLMRQDESGAVELRFFHDRWEAVPQLAYESFRSSNR